MESRVSVIVPHYRDLAGLDACLTALTAQTARAHQIIVADNNSPEGAARLAEVIAGRAELTIVETPGAGPARNGGVAVATGDTLAFTDSDCLPQAEWLANGLRALAGYDFVGGAMDVLVQDENHITAAEAFERVFAFDNRAYVLQKQFTVTANLFCSRTVFDDVGGFRVGVSEDLEWCKRAAQKGYRIGYAPDALVGHPARRTWADLKKKWSRLDREAFELALEAPAGRLRWLLKALVMPLSALAHAPKALTSSTLSRLPDRVKATLMLFRLRCWRSCDCLALLVAEGRS